MSDTWSVVTNLRVAEDHTYFVGCDEWGFSVWAHNQCVAEDVIQYHKLKRQLRLAELRAKHGDVFRQRMADTTTESLKYGQGRLVTEIDIQNSIIKSMRRQYEKLAARNGSPRPGVNLNFGGALPNWNSAQAQAYHTHLGEQMLELNRLSRFSPDSLAKNIANYHLLEQAGLIDYMRRQAGKYMLGVKPPREYTGQVFAAGHMLDSVAGGYFWRFIGWRDGVANSTIGSRWNAGRIVQITPGQFHWSN